MPDALDERLLASGLVAVSPDQSPLVRMYHKAGKAGWGKHKEATVLITRCDVISQSASDFLELSLRASKQVRAIFGHDTVRDLSNPTIEAMASLASFIAPHKRRNPWKPAPPLHIALLMHCSGIPPWGQTMINGTLHEHRHCISLCVLIDDLSTAICLPQKYAVKTQPFMEWLGHVLVAEAAT